MVGAQELSSPPSLRTEDLSPTQFGLPDSEVKLRRALGRPVSIVHGENGSILKYKGLSVWTDGTSILGANVTDEARRTRRGLQVSDTEMRTQELYGAPTSTYKSESKGTLDLFYQIERTEALVVTVKAGRVLGIYTGAIYD